MNCFYWLDEACIYSRYDSSWWCGNLAVGCGSPLFLNVCVSANGKSLISSLLLARYEVMLRTVEFVPACDFKWCRRAFSSLSAMAFSCWAALRATSMSALFLVTNSSSCFVIWSSCLVLCRLLSVSRATSVLLLSTASLFFKSASSWSCLCWRSSFYCEISLRFCLPLSTSFRMLITLVESRPSTSRLAYWRSSPSFERRLCSVSEYSSSS